MHAITLFSRLHLLQLLLLLWPGLLCPVLLLLLWLLLLFLKGGIAPHPWWQQVLKLHVLHLQLRSTLLLNSSTRQPWMLLCAAACCACCQAALGSVLNRH
jgi:hypothetical protein